MIRSTCSSNSCGCVPAHESSARRFVICVACPRDFQGVWVPDLPPETNLSCHQQANTVLRKTLVPQEYQTSEIVCELFANMGSSV
jgi:hypothetical protein